MKDSTKELLGVLLWTCGMLARPTLRNFTDSYETWAYRNRFRRQVGTLTRRRLLETSALVRSAPAPSERILRLTEAGRVAALGGRDPQLAWNRPWDGRWRLIVFDLPARPATVRNRLRKALRRRGWGWIQNSVWIRPHPIDDEKELVAGTRVNVESIVFFDGRPCAGETDQEIVQGAWDFREINRRYARCLEILRGRPRTRLRDFTADGGLRDWIGREQKAWLAAVSVDPLLPECLLPKGYLGREVWERRLVSSAETTAQMRLVLAGVEWAARQ